MRFKSIMFICALAFSIFANSYCKIGNYQVIAHTKKQHAVIQITVAAVNILKRQKADRFINDKEYTIRVRELIANLKRKGLIVK